MRSNSLFASVIALLCGMISLQAGATFAKRLFPALGPGGTTAMRLAFAAVILTLVWRPFRYKLTRAQLLPVMLYGISLSVMNMFFYMALQRLPLGIVVALEFTGPLAVATVASRRGLDFAWVAIAALGIVLLLPGVDPGAHVDLAGIVYALIAGVCWACYIVFGARTSAMKLPGGAAAALGICVGAVCLAPVGVAQAGTALLRPELMPLGLLVAVLSSAFPYSMEMIALGKLSARTFSVMMSLEPAVGALLGWALLGERLTQLQWAAVACVMVASAGAAVTNRPAVEAIDDPAAPPNGSEA